MQMRRPLYGIIPPGGTVAVHVSPPLQPEAEVVVKAATRPREVKFTVLKADTIVVQSVSQLPVAYGIMVVPTNVIGPQESVTDAWLAQLKLKVAQLFYRLRGGA